MRESSTLIYIIGGIIILGAIIFCISYFSKKSEESFEFKKYNGICVFDLDDTLTCGYDNAREAIIECKINECKIAINTARAAPYYKDIKLDKLGLTKEDFKEDFYYGDWVKDLTSSMSWEQLKQKIAETKVKHLDTLKIKYNVDPKKIILFDDSDSNIDAAKAAGYSTIHANSVACGLNENVVKNIRKIMNNYNYISM